jgi:hypothetical protein
MRKNWLGRLARERGLKQGKAECAARLAVGERMPGERKTGGSDDEIGAMRIAGQQAHQVARLLLQRDQYPCAKIIPRRGGEEMETAEPIRQSLADDGGGPGDIAPILETIEPCRDGRPRERARLIRTVAAQRAKPAEAVQRRPVGEGERHQPRRQCRLNRTARQQPHAGKQALRLRRIRGPGVLRIVDERLAPAAQAQVVERRAKHERRRAQANAAQRAFAAH